MNELYVYENWHRKRGAIHHADCSFCNHGKGFHTGDSRKNGKWHGPFSRDEAFQRAATMANIEPCKVCRPLEART